MISEVRATEDREFYAHLEQMARDHLARLGHYFEERGVPRRRKSSSATAPQRLRYAGEVGLISSC